MSITVRHDFREEGVLRDRDNFDPDSVDELRIVKAGSQQTIETFNSFSNPDPGVYEVEATEDQYSDDVEYTAEWEYTVNGVTYVTADVFRKTVLRRHLRVDAWIRLLRDVIPDFVACSDLYQDVSKIIGTQVWTVRKMWCEDIRKSAHIETAEKDALTRHADELGLARRDGETDAELRQRIALQQRLQKAGGTIDDIQNLLIAAASVEAGLNFDEDQVEVQEFFGRGDYAYFLITIDLDQILSITRSTMEDVIERAKAAGVAYQIRSIGEFGYVGVNSSPNDYPEVEGFNGLDVNGDPKDLGGRYGGINSR